MAKRSSLGAGWVVNLALAAAIVIGVGGLYGYSHAESTGPSSPLTGLSRPSDAPSGSDWRDDAIRRAFHEVLGREPGNSELRRYRYRMAEDNWSERDVAEDLRSRDDYRRMPDRRGADVDVIIRRAYEDILHRAPDRDGFLLYRHRMLDEGWTEWDLREVLRNSPEAFSQREAYAERVIRRAYQDVLRREPDRGGLMTYRRRILEDGWDEQDVRQALRTSQEKRRLQMGMSRERAEEIVTQAYRNVLRRDPDPQGLRAHVERVLRDHWTQQDVERVLRDSDEYRQLRR